MGLGPDFVSALFNTMKIETSAISEFKLCLRNLLSDLTNYVIVNVSSVTCLYWFRHFEIQIMAGDNFFFYCHKLEIAA